MNYEKIQELMKTKCDLCDTGAGSHEIIISDLTRAKICTACLQRVKEQYNDEYCDSCSTYPPVYEVYASDQESFLLCSGCSNEYLRSAANG